MRVLQTELLSYQAEHSAVVHLVLQLQMDRHALSATSGTTGESKGVILTYGQYRAGLAANQQCVPINDQDRAINFLPFTHIFERAWSYLCISVGAQLIVNTYPKEIQDSMRETHPTCLSYCSCSPTNKKRTLASWIMYCICCSELVA